MKDGEGSDESRVAQIGIKARQLIGGAHRLVRQGAKRHRRDVGAQSRASDGTLDALACPEAPRLGLGIRRRTLCGDDGLLDHRCRGPGQVAQRIGLDRDRAPIDQVEQLRPACLVEQAAGEPPLLVAIRRRRVGQEDDGDPELDGRLDVDGGALHPVAQEGLRNG